MAPAGRRELVIKNDDDLTVKDQCRLLDINRSSIYRKSSKREPSEEDILIMNQIDIIHTNHPTWGYRTITKIIRRDCEIIVNRKKVLRFMREMGVRTIYPKPNLSKRYHKKYIRPYLLRNLVIDRADQVWGIDITYIRMGRGFMYLFIIIDWYSRCIVDYELSTTLEKEFVMKCLKRATSKKRPEIINSDQGGHFTNPDYVDLINTLGIRISMDGRGQALDNVRTERFFRTLKYDLIYTNEFETPRDLRIELKKYIWEYNTYRPHSSIGDKCPLELYEGNGLSLVS